MTSLADLLPGPDDVVRCADHGRRIGLDPSGTAIRADRFVVVSVPLPWPKPVFAHDVLLGVKEAFASSKVPTRVLAAVPTPADEAVEVVIYDRAGPGQVFEHRYRVADRPGLEGLATALAVRPPGEVADGATDAGALDGPVALVCTQGSHDVCCGADGARFAAEADTIVGLTVRRVSHTGGHRFAPTLVTLPDGRMWADADLDLLRTVLWRTGHPSEIAERCRGWWGADPGPAQVAESAVLADVGWGFETIDRTVELESADGDRIRVTIRAGDMAWTVDVGPAREVPTIACRESGGLPAKTHREYEVIAIRSS